MAYNVQTWAWEQDVTPTRKLVLLAFAWYAHRDGSEARPKLATIVRKTGLARSTVIDALQGLEAAELIEATAYPDGGHGRPTTWHLNINGPAVDNNGPAVDNNGPAPGPLNGPAVDNNGPAVDNNGPAVGPSKNSGVGIGEGVQDLRAWLRVQKTDEGEPLHPDAVEHALDRVAKKKYGKPRAAALKIARDEHPGFAAEQVDRDRHRAETERIAACSRCDGNGWGLDGDGSTLDPAVKCDHAEANQ